MSPFQTPAPTQEQPKAAQSPEAEMFTPSPMQEAEKPVETPKQDVAKPSTAAKKPPAAAALPGIGEAAPASGIFGLFGSFMSLISSKKQAFTGKPASAMYYDKDKGRWIINGEDPSDDDVAPPPPPKARTVEPAQNGATTAPAPSKPEEAVSGLGSLT